jgi:hypothetical protein
MKLRGKKSSSTEVIDFRADDSGTVSGSSVSGSSMSQSVSESVSGSGVKSVGKAFSGFGTVVASGGESEIEGLADESVSSIGTAMSHGTPLPDGMPADCAFYVFIRNEVFEVKHSKYRGRKPFVLIEDEDCAGNISDKLFYYYLHFSLQMSSARKS